MKKLNIILVIIISLLLVCSCSSYKKSDDYKNSLSPKEFLFHSEYKLRIDGEIFTKYSKTIEFNNDEQLIELIKEDKIVSDLLINKKNKWYKFPNTDVYIKVFTGG